MILNSFPREDAVLILRIHLAHEAHDDYVVWGGQASGEFPV